MTYRKRAHALLLCGAIAAISSCLSLAEDPTADLLIQVLVRKGILTESEATEIRREVAELSLASEEAIARETPVRAAPPPVAMPKSLDGLKLYGDARFRYQYESKQKPSGDSSYRSRWRYRARFGAEYDFANSPISMGARLETASANDSTNRNWGGFFDKTGDELYLGLLYGAYRTDLAEFHFGKHKNPFSIDGAWWDGDINPEGLSESWQMGGIRFTAGQYLVSEEREDRSETSDHWMFMGQAEFEAAGVEFAPFVWTFTGGRASYEENTRTGGSGFSGENANGWFHDQLIVALPFAYSFQLSDQKQKIYGTWGINLQADDLLADADPLNPYYDGKARSGHDQFFNLGWQIGSAKRAGEWQFKTEYRFIEGAAYSPNLSDSDFAKNLNNQAGFLFQYRYNLTDFMQSGVTLMWSDAIDEDYQGQGKVGWLDEIQVLQVDASLKF